MSPAEVEAFVREHRTLIVASLGPRGHPHATPMWYGLLDGDVVFWPYAASQKAVNLRRDPRMSCLLEAGETYGELRGVLMEGTAQLSTDPERVARVGEAVAARNGLGGLGADAGEIRRRAAKRVAVTFRADRVTSWDHRKLSRP
jgi:PPOX class probable F420-dependent enzyme